MNKRLVLFLLSVLLLMSGVQGESLLSKARDSLKSSLEKAKYATDLVENTATWLVKKSTGLADKVTDKLDTVKSFFSDSVKTTVDNLLEIPGKIISNTMATKLDGFLEKFGVDADSKKYLDMLSGGAKMALSVLPDATLANVKSMLTSLAGKLAGNFLPWPLSSISEFDLKMLEKCVSDEQTKQSKAWAKEVGSTLLEMDATTQSQVKAVSLWNQDNAVMQSAFTCLATVSKQIKSSVPGVVQKAAAFLFELDDRFAVAIEFNYCGCGSACACAGIGLAAAANGKDRLLFQSISTGLDTSASQGGYSLTLAGAYRSIDDILGQANAVSVELLVKKMELRVLVETAAENAVEAALKAGAIRGVLLAPQASSPFDVQMFVKKKQALSSSRDFGVTESREFVVFPGASSLRKAGAFVKEFLAASKDFSLSCPVSSTSEADSSGRRRWSAIEFLAVNVTGAVTSTACEQGGKVLEFLKEKCVGSSCSIADFAVDTLLGKGCVKAGEKIGVVFDCVDKVASFAVGKLKDAAKVVGSQEIVLKVKNELNCAREALQKGFKAFAFAEGLGKCFGLASSEEAEGLGEATGDYDVHVFDASSQALKDHGCAWRKSLEGLYSVEKKHSLLMDEAGTRKSAKEKCSQVAKEKKLTWFAVSFGRCLVSDKALGQLDDKLQVVECDDATEQMYGKNSDDPNSLVQVYELIDEDVNSLKEAETPPAEKAPEAAKEEGKMSATAIALIVTASVLAVCGIILAAIAYSNNRKKKATNASLLAVVDESMM